MIQENGVYNEFMTCLTAFNVIGSSNYRYEAWNNNGLAK